MVGDLEGEVIRLVAKREGIILDPVYSGRAMGDLLIRNREFSSNDTILFRHTAGTPALFEFAKELTALAV